ncbi:Sec-independent protein translocase protein TatB [Phenylobacterium sp. LjRoot219]|uniref:Sec-independent protein translocase protein TatB n=1 Tax=Phenylobacterium sp. LjRoot219 TaxID=3342283 RepID=UPI003ECCDE48
MFPEGRALEFLLAAVVALVVVGPKDLPVLMRKLGQFLGKMRAMAAEFRASFDEMARQSELDELRKEVEAMRHAQFADVAAQAGQAEVQDVFTDIRQDLDGVTHDLHGGPPAPEPAIAAPAPEAPKAKPRAPRKTAAATAAAPSKTAAKPRTRKKAEPEA